MNTNSSAEPYFKVYSYITVYAMVPTLLIHWEDVLHISLAFREKVLIQLCYQVKVHI